MCTKIIFSISLSVSLVPCCGCTFSHFRANFISPRCMEGGGGSFQVSEPIRLEKNEQRFRLNYIAYFAYFLCRLEVENLSKMHDFIYKSNVPTSPFSAGEKIVLHPATITIDIDVYCRFFSKYLPFSILFGSTSFLFGSTPLW